MKRLSKPIQPAGSTCPRFYEGTLQEKYQELSRIQKRIESISSNEDLRPSERLLDQRGELEIEIGRHLVDGEVLEDAFMDYCLRHFDGGTSHNVNMESVRSPSVFEIIPAVKKFVDYIKTVNGQKVLSTYGKIPRQLGVIAGDCKFAVEDKCFRNLYVPVRQLLVFNAEKNIWEEGAKHYDPKQQKMVVVNDLFSIMPDIFSHPGMNFAFSGGKSWTTDNSKEMYIPGPAPEESSIYVGNGEVEGVLNQIQTLTRPAREVVITPAPQI